jgi:hypothetical protein
MPTPYTYEIPETGVPATEHLDKNGHFATINPAGTRFTLAADGTLEQTDVGTEIPPSVARIRATGTGFVNPASGTTP